MPGSELVVAAPAEAAAVLAGAGAGEGFEVGGLAPAAWTALGALLHAAGPWVDVAPPPLLAALAELPSLEEDVFDALAARWQAVEALRGWEAEDVAFLLQQVGEAAESAGRQGKLLILRPRD